MDVIAIPVIDVDPGKRLRPIDEDHAQAIGAVMAQNGQQMPIEVQPQRADGKWPLISGGHRLRGAELWELPTIEAVVRDVDDMEALLLQIDENLFRHDLNALDRSVFLARRKALYLELHPEAKAGGARQKGQKPKFGFLFPSFADATAEKLGFSKTSINRAIDRANGLSDEVKALIGTSWIAQRGAYLDAIKVLTSAEQRDVVRLLLERAEAGDTLTVASAIRTVKNIQPARKDITEADFQKLMRVWKRCSLEVQGKFLREIGAKITGGRS
jgi:ParB family chromosome partitioning protein